MPDLAALALAAYADNDQTAERQQKDAEAQQIAETIGYAEITAKRILGEFATQALEFQFVAEPANADTAEAEADMPGKPGYGIRYVDSEDHDRLYLIRPCSHCGHVRQDEIQSLPHLGQLLADGTTT